ncbi:MAG: isopeptide-forming domain-containing fimbrial protein, partial [Chloroflexota bacterium]
MLTNTSKSLLFAISLFALLLSGLFISQVSADPDAPDLGILTIDHSVGENEPLIGGAVSFDITLGNAGSNPVTDKGYNITISNTLPISVTFTGATIDPTYIENQSDGTTLLIWDNISDLEVSEELSLSVSGSIDPSLTNNDSLTNTVVARFNHAPDNSLAWEEVTDTVTAPLQAVDIEVTPKQSTADEQATGAGEYDGNADWAYEYEITVKNNNVGSTDAVDAQVVLPAGVAYLGGVTISPNPNGSSTTPDFTLNEDGSLELVWDLGTLTTAHYTNPVVITFDTAIPYKFRTSSDILAAAGPFAGPMSGSVIPEDTVMSVTYEATATYLSEDAPDGTTSTTQDDSPVEVTAEYLTISKSGTPKTVGIGDTVVFDIDYYVSEYYTTTNVVITDILPDGMTYVSSSLFPSNIENNTPGTGQTRLTYDIPTPNTIPGASGTIQVTATVDSTYEAAPYAGEPVVSGDSLTNRANLANDWSDIITEGRSDTGLPDDSKATVSTIPPSITKDVKDPETGNWGDSAYGFTGDTIYFKINFEQAANVDGKEVVVRDFLPRGMTFDASTDTYSSTGTFANSGTCNTNLTSPTVGTLNGLQYLEWKLCSVDQGSTWEVQFGATLGPTPDIQPGWIVGNFGKLSYQNTFADGYSQRDFATVDYVAPELVLTKTASPSTDLKGNDVVSYTITVENHGEATAYNLNLLDTVPEWLAFAASGGSATPSASGFTADTGAQAGTGGTLTWSQVASLAEGESLTFTYQATVVDGVPAGQNLVNIASVSYNSRSDNTGHAVTHSTNTNEKHTDDNTV